MTLQEAEVLDLREQVEHLRQVLAMREQELLNIQGPCRKKSCTLHRDHAGDCDRE